MKPSVTVLLSTYNGEKYLSAQLESVLAQKNVELRLLIRDDCSSDSTPKILKDYARKDNRIEVISGDNLGPTKSFIELIRYGERYRTDYYAFCDQDDIWENEKLSIAIDKLSNMNSLTPNCYYSNLKIVDSNLCFIRMAHKKQMYRKNKFTALVSEVATGCTMVFNYRVAQIISTYTPKDYSMHDVLVYTLCKIMGETVYDSNAYIQYRQHQNNVLGMSVKKSIIKNIKRRFVRLLDESKQPIYMNAIVFENTFHDLLSLEDIEMLKRITQYKQSGLRRIRLLFSGRLHGDSVLDDMRYRMLIIFGRI